MKKELVGICGALVLFSSCNLFQVKRQQSDVVAQKDSIITIDTLAAKDSVVKDNAQNKDTVAIPPSKTINTGNVRPDELIAFAETLIGTPYSYGSTNPSVGFDCSGFITYVFNHFKISVPRSSIDFTNVGKTIPVETAKRGDIILFTGTDSTEKFVGHMGLVTENNNGQLQFIHSTSGKKYGVTITPLNDYYKGRFVKTLRIFPQNDL